MGLMVTISSCVTATLDDSDHVFIKTLTGKSFMIPVNLKYSDALATTVDELRNKLNVQEGIPPEQQSLIYNGKRLCRGKNVHKKLSAHGITSGDVVNLLIKLNRRRLTRGEARFSL